MRLVTEFVCEAYFGTAEYGALLVAPWALSGEEAAVVLLQEVLIRKGTTVKVRRELRQMFPKYECYIVCTQQSANHSSHFPTQTSFSN